MRHKSPTSCAANARKLCHATRAQKLRHKSPKLAPREPESCATRAPQLRRKTPTVAPQEPESCAARGRKAAPPPQIRGCIVEAWPFHAMRNACLSAAPILPTTSGMGVVKGGRDKWWPWTPDWHSSGLDRKGGGTEAKRPFPRGSHKLRSKGPNVVPQRPPKGVPKRLRHKGPTVAQQRPNSCAAKARKLRGKSHKFVPQRPNSCAPPNPEVVPRLLNMCVSTANSCQNTPAVAPNGHLSTKDPKLRGKEAHKCTLMGFGSQSQSPLCEVLKRVQHRLLCTDAA